MQTAFDDAIIVVEEEEAGVSKGTREAEVAARHRRKKGRGKEGVGGETPPREIKVAK
jgi:hypothetical protein